MSSEQTIGDIIDAGQGVYLTSSLAPYFAAWNNGVMLAIVYKTLHHLTWESEEHACLKKDFDDVPWRKCTYAYIAEKCQGWVTVRQLQRLIPTLIDAGYVVRKEKTVGGHVEHWYTVNRNISL